MGGVRPAPSIFLYLVAIPTHDQGGGMLADMVA